MYFFLCLCGNSIGTITPSGVCANCGQHFDIFWPEKKHHIRAPELLTEAEEKRYRRLS